jgi:hypothetical protein
MFKEVIHLTKKHMHTRNIFPCLLQANTSIENLKSYRFEVFYDDSNLHKIDTNFEYLCPTDFIGMLSHWSQMALIKLAAKESSLKELLKVSERLP